MASTNVNLAWPEISGIQLAPLSMRARTAIFAPPAEVDAPRRRAVRWIGRTCLAAAVAGAIVLGSSAPARGAMWSWATLGIGDDVVAQGR